jgi:hypothetical protein
MEALMQRIKLEIDARVRLIGDFEDIKVLRHEALHQWVAILRNCNGEAGSWRLQRFDENGFIGHQAYRSKEEAIRNAARERFTLADDGALDRLERTASFRIGNAVSDERDKLNASRLSFSAFLARVTQIKAEYCIY